MGRRDGDSSPSRIQLCALIARLLSGRGGGGARRGEEERVLFEKDRDAFWTNTTNAKWQGGIRDLGRAIDSHSGFRGKSSNERGFSYVAQTAKATKRAGAITVNGAKTVGNSQGTLATRLSEKLALALF